jgi:hypothetical protein
MAITNIGASPAVADAGEIEDLGDVPSARDGRPLIEPDPNRSGADRALLAGTGIPVWAIVALLQALTGDDVDAETDESAIRQAASDYRIDRTLVAAGVAYYQTHRAAIDARLARNAAAAS